MTDLSRYQIYTDFEVNNKFFSKGKNFPLMSFALPSYRYLVYSEIKLSKKYLISYLSKIYPPLFSRDFSPNLSFHNKRALLRLKDLTSEEQNVSKRSQKFHLHQVLAELARFGTVRSTYVALAMQ